MQYTSLLELLPSWTAGNLARLLLGLAVTLLLGVIAQQLLRLVLRIFRQHLSNMGGGNRKERVGRANTLTTVIAATASVIIWTTVFFALLSQLGVDLGPFLASAGILGLALSFGSQELVKDIISGLFFLLENQFNTGDYLEIGDKKGRVVSMSLRTIILQNSQTEAIYIIRNSQVGVLTRFVDESMNDHAGKLAT